MLAVLHSRQAIGHRAGARSIAAGWHLLFERLVWPLEVIDLAPFIEPALHFGEIAKAPQRKYFILERAMKALVLATALWVVRPAV